MKLLIAYATTEGQTRKISQTLADQVVELGHQVELLDTARKRRDVHIDDFDAFIVAASVHQDRHQNEIEVFVAASLDVLKARPGLFISVSLAAAFSEKATDATAYISDFISRTGWTPDHSLTVAGAVKSEEYDYFQQQILEHIILKDRDELRPDEPQEFTDWTGLANSVKKFLAQLDSK
ncbi:flavodoxin domain-containing protein [Anderseniella sp. Alg231-50]|uniref:flavodoxin domain-containing protein n=1 Tax=Anderseniella sp. Alg231-50 TaxID=1922226 RepID=UPI000D55913B